MKRYLYIIVGIIVVVVIALLLWGFFAKSSPNTSGTATGGINGTLPSTGTQTGTSTGNQLGQLGNLGGSSGDNGSGTAGGAAALNIAAMDPTFDYFVDASSNVFAVEPDGKISETSNGQVNYLSSTEVTGLADAGFSHDGAKTFVNFGTGTSTQTSLFDMVKKTWTPLPTGMVSPEWSPSDYRIAYLATISTGVESLFTLDTSKATNKPVSLLTLSANDLSLQWINKNQIVLSDKPSAYVDGSAWLFTLSSGSLTPIVSEISGFEAVWSGTQVGSSPPMGLGFAAPSTAQGGVLELLDLSGNTTQNFKFLTLPSKCVFGSVTSTNSIATTTTATSTKVKTPAPVITTSLSLYCAVPRDQDQLSGSILPDDYNQMALLTSDNLYQIDISSGDITTLFTDPTQNVDATDVKVFNGTLYFIDRYTQELRSLSLSSGQ